MDYRCTYGFGRSVELDCDTAVARVRSALEARGYAVLFQLEVGDLWRGKKKGARYVILGACNPRAASRAYEVDRNIGLVLPCHLAIYDEEEGRTKIMAADPASFMDMLRRPAAVEMAIDMKDQLEAIVNGL